MDISKQDLIFNGTGINYSWHFPNLFDLSDEELRSYKTLTFISGATTSFLVYWAVREGLVTWSADDFFNWSRKSREAYEANLFTGLIRLLKIRFGSSRPVFSREQYQGAWAGAVKPEFFDVRLKDLPKNVRIPLVNLDSKRVEVASPDSSFGEQPAYLVSFAATAIPTVYPEVRLGDAVYGDVTFVREFLPWLKTYERQSESFVNYNLLKKKDYPNGKYIKICDHPKPKQMIQRDNLKFILGLNIPSYAENVRRSKLIQSLHRH